MVANFNTTGQGVPPCHLQVLNSGQFAVEDSYGVTWTLNNKLAVPTGNGVMRPGQTLAQVMAHCKPHVPVHDVLYLLTCASACCLFRCAALR